MKSFKLASLALAVVVLAAPSARGALLVPGSILIPAAAEPDPVGATLIATTTLPFAAGVAFSGTLTSSVYSPDPSNPLGGLTFTYQISNDAVSANSIGRLTVSDFTGFATDASYQIPPVGLVPASIDRNVGSNVLGFNFFPLPIAPGTGFLAPGVTSSVLVVQTDAPFFVPSTSFVINGGVTTVGSFGPSLIPEPSTLALGLMSLATFAVRRRK